MARHFILPLAAVLALAFAGAFQEKGPMVLEKAKLAVVSAASAMLAACTGLTGKVRADDKTWLTTKCPAEARKAAQELDVFPTGDVTFDPEYTGPNPNVIEHIDYGAVEVRDGPVEVSASFMTTAKGIGLRLFGDIRTGTDGASVRLTRAKKWPDGPEFPICAIVWDRGSPDLPGIPKKEVGPFPPASELHPGFILVDYGALMVDIAL